MKTLFGILGLNLAFVSAQAQLANYQSTVAAQNPAYYFHFDNSLVDSVGGTVTFTNVTTGAGFGSDYFGNPSSATSFAATTDYLTGSPGTVSGVGTSTALGSLSLLFFVPSTIPTTGYIFSDSDTTGGASGSQPANSAFALQFSSSALALKVGNKTQTLLASASVAANTWYYLGLTYNLNGTAMGTNGVNYYVGAIGGTLSSGFIQKGGSGNISTTSTLGDGNTFVVGNKQQAVVPTSAGLGTAGIAGGEVDELAMWSAVLSSTQINSQFDALAPVPEPSGLALVGTAGLLFIIVRKTRKAEPRLDFRVQSR
jgi:hypothetical protein